MHLIFDCRSCYFITKFTSYVASYVSEILNAINYDIFSGSHQGALQILSNKLPGIPFQLYMQLRVAS